MADERTSQPTQRGRPLAARLGLKAPDPCCTRWMDSVGATRPAAGEHSERQACASCRREYLVTFHCAEVDGTLVCNAIEALSIES